MNKLTKEEKNLIKHQEQLLAAVERPYIRKLIKEKNRFIRLSANEYGLNQDIPQFLLLEHSENIKSISTRYNSLIIGIFVRDFFSTYTKALKVSVKRDEAEFELWLRRVIALWIHIETGRKAKLIARTTLDDIKKAIAAATVVENTTSRAVAEKILRTRGVSAHRASTIARTETSSAAMYASMESAKKLSIDTGLILKKKWLPVTDSRTRTSHGRMLNHPPIELDELFKVGAERLSRPNDSRGSAKHVINCRCKLTYKA